MSKRSTAIAYHLYHQSKREFFDLRDGTICGRREGDLVFPSDDMLSRKHCKFTISGNDIYVEDLNSTNRTCVNTVPIRQGVKRRIQIHDVIEIGGQRMVLTARRQIPPGGIDNLAKARAFKVLKNDDGSLTMPHTQVTARTFLSVDRLSFHRLQLEQFLKRKVRVPVRTRAVISGQNSGGLRVSYGTFLLAGMVLGGSLFFVSNLF